MSDNFSPVKKIGGGNKYSMMNKFWMTYLKYTFPVVAFVSSRWGALVWVYFANVMVIVVKKNAKLLDSILRRRDIEADAVGKLNFGGSFEHSFHHLDQQF